MQMKIDLTLGLAKYMSDISDALVLDLVDFCVEMIGQRVSTMHFFLCIFSNRCSFAPGLPLIQFVQDDHYFRQLWLFVHLVSMVTVHDSSSYLFWTRQQWLLILMPHMSRDTFLRRIERCLIMTEVCFGCQRLNIHRRRMRCAKHWFCRSRCQDRQHLLRQEVGITKL